MLRCPCCGSEVDRPFLVDINSNTVARGDRIVRVTASQAILIDALWRAYPAAVVIDDLRWALYGGRAREPGNPRATIKVMLSHCRYQLTSVGIGIKGSFGQGEKQSYRLVVHTT